MLPNKIYSSRNLFTSFESFDGGESSVAYGIPQIPQTLQATANAMGYPPEIDSNRVLLKTAHT